MKTKVPWTKTMLDKFIEECLLTEDEERILRTRIAGWTIVKQSLEFRYKYIFYIQNYKGTTQKIHTNTT